MVAALRAHQRHHAVMPRQRNVSYAALTFTQNEIPIADARHIVVLQGSHSRSVSELLNKRHRALFTRCDLLVVGLNDSTATGRQSLLVDLPNTLRRVAARHAILLHGPIPCSQKSQPFAIFRGFAVAEQCWHDEWIRLVSAGVIEGALCHDVRGGERWCTGMLAVPSLCRTKSNSNVPALLHGPGAPVTIGLPSRGPWLERPIMRNARYFTAFNCDRRICLAFKNGVEEDWVGAFISTDGLHFAAEPSLLMPASWNGLHATHNMALLREENGGFLLAGGRFIRANSSWMRQQVIKGRLHRHAALAGFDGIHIVRGHGWRFVAADTDDELASSFMKEPLLPVYRQSRSQWQHVGLAVSGRHAGCSDARDPMRMPWVTSDACEFDGRLSLVHFRGSYWLYTRLNTGSHGQRFVAVTTSTDLRIGSWGQFQRIHLRGYNVQQGEIYFFLVEVNPARSDTLVAFFPLVHRLRSCVAASVSSDGVNWSTPTPLAACETRGERALDHPAQGLVRLERNASSVALYIQRRIVSLAADKLTPRPLRHTLLTSTEQLLGATYLVRHEIPLKRLAEWTAAQLRAL